MIHLTFGSDRNKILVRSQEVVSDYLGGLSGALFVRLHGEEFEKAKFEELIDGRSLFSKKIVVLCDGLLANKETVNFVLKRVDDIAASNNIFVFRDDILDKKTLEVFKNKGTTAEEFCERAVTGGGYAGAREVKLKTGYETFNIFSFTDAIGRKDKKTAWVLFHKALRAGFPVEELFWKVIWIFRNILLASSLNADQKGVTTTLKISPFVFNKAKSFVGCYHPEQLLSKYRDLLDIYHETRRGVVDIEMATEQFILTL
ncbi:MAG: hypothetical protein HY226_03395 [Candidatus Vogelbacteria bacterium]|nr:hypothetical protein [Candidatus Vogelbacteria bacterium]